MVHFRRDGLKLSVNEVKGNIPGRNTSLPVALSSQKALTLVEIEHSGVTVYNFGMPFYNPGHASEDWLLRNEPIVGTATLMHILKQQSFRFVVPAAFDLVRNRLNPDRLPPPRVFPYGQEHRWDISRYARDAPTWVGPHFPPSLTFRNDNDHAAIMSQSVVQDVWWLHLAQQAILKEQIPVYFVPREKDNNSVYYVVVQVPEALRVSHDDAWRHFVVNDTLKVRLFDYLGQSRHELDQDGKRNPIPDWDAEIMENPESIKVLKDNGHLEREGLVLRVRRPKADNIQRVPDFNVIEFSTLQEAEQLETRQ